MKNRISIERPIHPEVLKVAKDVRKEIIAVNRISNGQCHTASTIIVQRLKEKGTKESSLSLNEDGEECLEIDNFSAKNKRNNK